VGALYSQAKSEIRLDCECCHMDQWSPGLEFGLIPELIVDS
jgi:hypothetical protein